jgi:hypothetical protein
LSADDGRDYLFMGVEPDRLERARVYLVLVRSDEVPEPQPEPPPAAPSCVCSPGHRRYCFFRSSVCPCE